MDTTAGAFRTNVDVPTAIPPRASTVPYRSEHTRHGYPPSNRTCGGVPIALLHTGISSRPPDTFAGSVHEPQRNPWTHAVDEREPKACQHSRPGGTTIHFGDFEGDRTVRPLILSETRTLSDKGAPSDDGDSQGELAVMLETHEFGDGERRAQPLMCCRQCMPVDLSVCFGTHNSYFTFNAPAPHG